MTRLAGSAAAIAAFEGSVPQCEEILRNQNYLIMFSREVMGKVYDNPYNSGMFFGLAALGASIEKQRTEISHTLELCRRTAEAARGSDDAEALREQLHTLREQLLKGTEMHGEYGIFDMLQWQSGFNYIGQCAAYREQCAETLKALDALEAELFN